MRPLSPEDPADPPWALALHNFLGSLHPTLEDNLAEELPKWGNRIPILHSLKESIGMIGESTCTIHHDVLMHVCFQMFEDV